MKHKVVPKKVRGLTIQDEKGRGVVTVVLAKKHKSVARGVSICSVDDNFSMIDGFNRAKGRAIKALANKENDLLIARADVDDRLLSVGYNADLCEFKSEINPTLTDFEKELLS